jgi:hypothetical protein
MHAALFFNYAVIEKIAIRLLAARSIDTKCMQVTACHGCEAKNVRRKFIGGILP